jgi:hypothetical protein
VSFVPYSYLHAAESIHCEFINNTCVPCKNAI